MNFHTAMELKLVGRFVMGKKDRDEHYERWVDAERRDRNPLPPARWQTAVQHDRGAQDDCAEDEETPEYMTATYWG